MNGGNDETTAIILILAGTLLSGCGKETNTPAETNEKPFEPVVTTVKDVNHFGDVFLDLEEIDLAYGDSINIRGSNGYERNGLPYYSEFYGTYDTVLLTDRFADMCLGAAGINFNETANIQAGDTITITLDERGKYREMYEACNIDPNNSQREDQSDAAFINARQLSSGTIREGMLYRGASPFDNKFGRAELMGDYLEAQGITYILDLADSPEKLLSYENLPEYTASLIREEKVIALHLGIDYTTPEAMAAIKEGVFFLSEANSPVLIHCSIGRDRTGFICALLEALCGASYDEILDDYMLSYENLHDINMDPDSLQYQLFSDRLLELFELNVGLKREDIKTADLKETARNYFLRCDLTEEQVDQLIRNITVQQ